MISLTRLALIVSLSVAAAGSAAAIETVPGMPPVVDPANLYSETTADKLSPAVARRCRACTYPIYSPTTSA